MALSAELAALHPKSWGWALACANRRREDAEDVLHDAYDKVLSGRARFSGSSTFKTWLFGVIRLTALEHRRWRWIRRGSEPIEEVEIPASAPHVDRETAEALARAMTKLSDRQREVLHLVFYEGLSIAEAADITGITLGTARIHYERGKASLLAILTKEGVRFP